jgi:DNA invertase Pin-like site-specific DNA recombinase
MLVGYARTSTPEQEAGLEVQQQELVTLGCERMFSEQCGTFAELEH